jgi:hypothetical protein
MGSERPVRVQLSRKLGWKMPSNTVSVVRPGRWGNPFIASQVGMPAAVNAFREVMTGSWNPRVLSHLTDCGYEQAYRAREIWLERLKWHSPSDGAKCELRGRNLACWCPLHQLCHADVLLEIANG